MAPGLSNKSRQSRVGGGVLVWSGYSWVVWLGRKVTMEGWPLSFTAQYCRRQGIVTVIENVTNFYDFCNALLLLSLRCEHFFILADNGLLSCTAVVAVNLRK